MSTTVRQDTAVPAAPEDPPPSPRVRRVVGLIGRAMIATGALVLLFVVYQLWGTGLRTARAQDALRGEFEAAVEEADAEREAAGSGAEPDAEPRAVPPVPARGEVVQALPGFEFHVMDADPRRVKRVRIIRKRQAPRRRLSRGEAAPKKDTGPGDASAA